MMTWQWPEHVMCPILVVIQWPAEHVMCPIPVVTQWPAHVMCPGLAAIQWPAHVMCQPRCQGATVHIYEIISNYGMLRAIILILMLGT